MQERDRAERAAALWQKTSRTHQQKNRMMQPVKLSTKSLKVSAVIDAAALARIVVPDGSGPVPFALDVGGVAFTGTFKPKTLRKAIKTAAEGAATIAMISGKLVNCTTIAEAGVSLPAPPASNRGEGA
jgi:hypothetical protein